MASHRHSVLTALFVEYFGSFLSIALNFLSVRIVVDHLGSETYGIWLSLLSSMGLATIFDFGVSVFVMHRLSGYKANAEGKSLAQHFSGAFALHTASMLTVAIVFLGQLLVFGESDNQRTIYAVLVLLGTLLSMGCSLHRALLMSQGRLVIVSVLNQLAPIVTALVTSILVLCGAGFISLPLGYLASVVVADIPCFFIARRSVSVDLLQQRYFNFHDGKEAIKYSWSYWLIKGADLLKSNAPRLAIAGAFTGSELTRFAVSNRVPDTVSSYMGKLGNLLMPYLSGMYRGDEHAALRRVYMMGLTYHVRFGLFACICLMAMNTPFVGLWIGPGSAIEPVAMALLAVFAALRIQLYFNNGFLNATGKFKLQPYVMAFDAVACTGLSYILIGRLGLIGVALAVVVPCAFSVAYSTYSLIGTLRVEISVLGAHIFRVALIPSLASALVAWISYDIPRTPSWLFLILQGLLILCANLVPRELPLIFRRPVGESLNRCLRRCIESGFY